jgi:hypothetical protein
VFVPPPLPIPPGVTGAIEPFGVGPFGLTGVVGPFGLAGAVGLGVIGAVGPLGLAGELGLGLIGAVTPGLTGAVGPVDNRGPVGEIADREGPVAPGGGVTPGAVAGPTPPAPPAGLAPGPVPAPVVAPCAQSIARENMATPKNPLIYFIKQPRTQFY